MNDIEGLKGKEKLSVDIAPARAEDARDIVELLRAGWLETYPNEGYGITREDIEKFWEGEMAEEHIAARARRYANPPLGTHFMVAKSEGKVVGLLQVRTGGERNIIQTLYVSPEHHRKGVGRALFESARAHLDPQKETRLSVVVYNEQAQAFYRSLGFKNADTLVSSDALRLHNGKVVPEIDMELPAEVQSSKP